MTSSFPDPADDVLQSLYRRMIADLRSGSLASLEDYLSRFPGQEEVVEQEWRRFSAESQSSPVATVSLIVETARQQPESERESFLSEICGDDIELCTEVLRLLAFSDGHGNAANASEQENESGVVDEGSAVIREVMERLKQRGVDPERYTEREEVARGGMGSIVRVTDQELHRDLAMKRLKDPRRMGMAGLARFLEEAQVTGQLDHPGVVPVHDLGVDQNGDLFFTMKLVKGDSLATLLKRARDGKEPLTDYRLVSILQRACEALSFAHSKGVVHRDLKPDNIMVGRFGETFVMDWGLAKVLNPDEVLTDPSFEAVTKSFRLIESDRQSNATPDSPLLTLEGAVAGTPNYMAPEQAEGRLSALGPWTDVYAMGAILYEVLAGQRPYQRPGVARSPRQIIELVRQVPPKRIRELASGVNVELEAICERAMSRSMKDRYPSMKELGNDLSAFLEGRVVQAHAVGAWAELRKWVGRNRTLASTIAAAVIAVAAFAAWAWSERNEAQENAHLASISEDRSVADKERAEGESARYQGVIESLSRILGGFNSREMGQAFVEIMESQIEIRGRESGQEAEAIQTSLASLDLLLQQVNPTTVAQIFLSDQILESALQKVGEDLKDDPVGEARLREEIAQSFNELGLYARAVEEGRRALDLVREILPPEDPQILSNLNNLGAYLRGAGRPDEALPLYREALQIRRRVLGNNAEQTLISMGNLGQLLREMGHLDEAVELVRESKEGFLNTLGEEHPFTLVSISEYGQLLLMLGRLQESEETLMQAVEISRRVNGDNHMDTFALLSVLGDLLQKLGKLDEAEVLLRDSLEKQRQMYGSDHPWTMTSLLRLGNLLYERGQLDEAETVIRECLAARLRLLGKDHWETAAASLNLARVLWFKGEVEEAEELERSAVSVLRHQLGNQHRNTLSAIHNLGITLFVFKKSANEAEVFVREAMEGRSQRLGPEHPDTLTSTANLGTILLESGKLEEAEALLRFAYERRASFYGPAHESTLATLHDLVSALDGLNRVEEATVLAEELLRLTPSTVPEHEKRERLLERVGTPDRSRTDG